MLCDTYIRVLVHYHIILYYILTHNQSIIGIGSDIHNRRYKESRQLAQRYEHYEKQHVQQSEYSTVRICVSIIPYTVIHWNAI